MRIIRAPWLTHPGEIKDFEAYSCHISPDGSRLVTAAGDGHVRIWSTEAIYNAHDSNYTKPRQLAAISHHSGTIHTVRFSGNNKYLASGADDKIVCIYVLDPNPPAHASTFGTNEPPPVENWRVFRRLIGHDNDIQDLGWSYDSSILVSVGLDSKVVIWSGHTFEKLKTLSQHQSHVKGITFDPANKYFATASDDRTIKIFRFTSPPPNATAYDQLNNFILEHTITAPFQSSPLTTYFRRCSWSPDGNHIAAANSVNGPVSSVAIINRGNWDSDINLIGHELPIEVCAFSPRMFYREKLTPAQLDQNGHPTVPSVTVIACAGQDKSLSVWNTSFARPFVIMQDLTAKSITDLAWSCDGESLFLTSLDGSITTVVFEPGELGYPAPIQENERSLSKFGASRKAGIIEGPEALLLEENSKAGELKGVQGRMGELMGDGTPHAIPSTNGTNGTASAPAASSAIITNGTSSATDQSNQTTQPPADTRVEELKSRVTIVNGKKRVKPILVSASSGLAESALPQTQLVSAATQGARSDAPHTILDLSKPYDGFPKGGLAGLLIGNKRKFADIEGDEEKRIEKRLTGATRNGSASIVVNGPDGLVPPSTGSRPPQSEVPEPLRPALFNPNLSVSQIRLATPMVRSVILRTVDGSEPPQTNGADTSSSQQGSNDDTVVLEVRNASGPTRTGRPQDRDPTRVNCTRRGQSLWQDYLPKAVLQLTGNSKFWAASCEDASVHVWTPAGRRLVNPFVVEAQPVIMDCRGWWLLCITAVGTCYVWNIKTMSAPHPPIHLAPILDAAIHSQGLHLTPSPSIIFARLNSQGRIIVAMSNGDGYTYSPSMFVWQRLSEPWWAVGSQYWNTTDSSVGNLQSSSDQGVSAERDNQVSIENVSAGIIPLLERNTTNHSLMRGRAYFLQRLIKALLSAEGFEGLESSVSVAHLENRVAAALTLGARDEFKIYLLMYAKRLGAEGLKGKVVELLRSLRGDPFIDEDYEEQESSDKEDELCGWKKEDLLKEVVLILGKHRDLQRITVPYARSLNILDDRLGDQQMVTDM
ncbi:putative histone transcription regulator Hir1 [Patellaria atrata CBS 101060]|uniref:Protein HIR n=1 Tax=Patellaria atrata CBS 101060 TaxID=1346257 RepID=A0A9P4SH22_9PEZI|nr:putative histone transcription regulator Hir1 [Patellaria atrata CBS 101060]